MAIYQRQQNNQDGSALLLTLFFSAIFIMMFGATLSYIMAQHRAVLQEVHRVQGVHAAEAGVAYYRWHLAHDPTDYVTDTGEHTYTTQDGTPFATFDITVTPPESGSTVATITAAGSSNDAPNVLGRVRARYGKPTLAHYAFISNSNVWFGEGEEISGELHSNGGVRMDGEGDSLLTSAQETYICGSEHGCADEEQPGVWGDGEDPDLWEYPAEPIDFNSIILNLDQIQTDAQAEGIYLPDSGSFGYFVVFNSDGTLTINTVTDVDAPVYGYDGTDWTYESNDKTAWTPVAGYVNVDIPDNGLVFLEDDVWIGGDVNGRATVVAARLPDGSFQNADIYIQEDITYISKDGTNSLGLIAQQDVLVPLVVDEEVLEIDAAIVAVHGHAFRYYYPLWTSEPYNSYAILDQIETYGTIITNTSWTWSWVSGAGGPVTSGFQQTETTYDPDLTYAAPPAFPTEDEYAFIQWKELELTEE